MKDQIHIEELVLKTRIGVPDEERAQPQRLTANITLVPADGFGALHDEIERTVDYSEVATLIDKVAGERPRRLIETLAEDMAASLLRNFPLEQVAIELRKHILPNTAFVAVRIVRDREDLPA